MANNLLRKPQSQDEVKNKYEFLGFTRNPFPVEPTVKPDSDDERSNGSIFFKDIRQNEINDFKRILIDSDNKLSVMMDYAAYRGRGIGKTAYLNYLKRNINKDFGDELTGGRSVLYAVYVAPTADDTSRSLSQITKYAYDFMRKDNIFFIIYCRLRAMSGYLDEVLYDEELNSLEETIANDDWLRAHEVEVDEMNWTIKSELREIGFDVLDSLFSEFSFSDFEKIICKNLNDYQWKKEGSLFFFNQLERLFKAACFTNCVILLDEAEKLIQHQNFSERRTFCENVRNYFIDGNSSNAIDGFYKMLITLHPNSQELLMPHWSAAGLDRICQLGGGLSEPNTVYFKPLADEKNMNVNLALAYLDPSRTVDTLKGKLTPFTREALCYAMTREEGIVGRYLKLLYLCVEKAVINSWTTIDKEQIDLVKDGSPEDSANFNISTAISDPQPVEALPESKVIL